MIDAEGSPAATSSDVALSDDRELRVLVGIYFAFIFQKILKDFRSILPPLGAPFRSKNKCPNEMEHLQIAKTT